MEMIKGLLIASDIHANADGEGIPESDAERLLTWMNEGWKSAFEVLSMVMVRQGMAEEWALDPEERDWSRRWAVALALPAALKGEFKTSGIFSAPLRSRDELILFTDSRFIYVLSNWIRSAPIAGAVLQRIEHSSLGVALRTKLLRRMGRL